MPIAIIYTIAKGSATETDSWVDLLFRLELISDAEQQLLHEECLWIMQSLKAKIRDLERYEQQPKQSLRETYEPYTLQASSPPLAFSDADYL